VTTDPAASLPIPPLDLFHRAGHMADVDPVAAHVENVRFLQALLDSFLPIGWTSSGKRALDFGCGGSKVIRHFGAGTSKGEFWGCDIH
jgi:hypothetical protein